jgi:hypothetical protein
MLPKISQQVPLVTKDRKPLVVWSVGATSLTIRTHPPLWLWQAAIAKRPEGVSISFFSHALCQNAYWYLDTESGDNTKMSGASYCFKTGKVAEQSALPSESVLLVNFIHHWNWATPFIVRVSNLLRRKCYASAAELSHSHSNIPGVKGVHDETPLYIQEKADHFGSRSYLATDGQSASSSWCRAPFGTGDRTIISLSDNYFLSSSWKAPSLTRGRVCNFQCNHVLVRIAQDP